LQLRQGAEPRLNGSLVSFFFFSLLFCDNNGDKDTDRRHLELSWWHMISSTMSKKHITSVRRRQLRPELLFFSSSTMV
jgi:hypothetical protein